MTDLLTEVNLQMAALMPTKITANPHSHALPAAAKLAFMTSAFETISLEQLDTTADLQDRVDTKFGFSQQMFYHLLPALAKNYRLVRVIGRGIQPYQTLYFDTPNFDLYRLHVNERSNQYKVRIRRYLSTNATFLEIKHKNPKRRTIKDRIPLDSNFPIMDAEAANWVLDRIPADFWPLEPVLMNNFQRLIFVEKNMQERVTFDFGIQFNTNNHSAETGSLVIAEVKRCSYQQPSAFMELMHQNHLGPMGYSKFSVGVALLYGQVKKNNLKSKMLWMEKINHE